MQERSPRKFLQTHTLPENDINLSDIHQNFLTENKHFRSWLEHAIRQKNEEDAQEILQHFSVLNEPGLKAIGDDVCQIFFYLELHNKKDLSTKTIINILTCSPSHLTALGGHYYEIFDACSTQGISVEEFINLAIRKQDYFDALVKAKAFDLLNFILIGKNKGGNFHLTISEFFEMDRAHLDFLQNNSGSLKKIFFRENEPYDEKKVGLFFSCGKKQLDDISNFITQHPDKETADKIILILKNLNNDKYKKIYMKLFRTDTPSLENIFIYGMSRIIFLSKEDNADLIFSSPDKLAMLSQLKEHHLEALNKDIMRDIILKEEKPLIDSETFIKFESHHLDALLAEEEDFFRNNIIGPNNPMNPDQFATLNLYHIIALYDLKQVTFPLDNNPMLDFETFLKMKPEHLEKLVSRDEIMSLISDGENALIDMKKFLLMDKDHIEAFVKLKKFFSSDNDNYRINFDSFLKMKTHHLNLLCCENEAISLITGKPESFIDMNKFLELDSDHVDFLFRLKPFFFPENGSQKLDFKTFLKMKPYHFELLVSNEFQYLFSLSDDENHIPLMSFTQFAEMTDDTVNELIKILPSADVKKIIPYIFIANFFRANHEEIIKDPTSQVLTERIYSHCPAEVAGAIKIILNIMSKQNFREGNLKTTLGIEIEYTGVPEFCKELMESAMETIQKGWRHPGDSTVRSSPNCYQGEATSPIIHNGDEMRKAFLNIALLNAMGAQANNSCGLHVHVGVKNLPIPEKMKISPEIYWFEFMRQLIIIYKREEFQFNLNERPYNENIKKILNDKILYQSLSTARSIEDIYALMRDRYYEINPYAFSKHGTIEIRRFAGSCDIAHICRTLSLVNAMAEEAIEITNRILEQSLSLSDEKKSDNESPDQCARPIFGKIDSPMEIDENNNEFNEYYPELFLKQKTQLRTDFFKLESNPLLETTLQEVSLDEKNHMACSLIGKNGQLEIATIPCESEVIMKKLVSGTPLSPNDKNEILMELSRRGLAQVNERVEKTKNILEEKPSSLPRRQS